MLTRMGPEGRVTAALMLGGLGMMGGVMALPFVEDIEGALDWVWKHLSDTAPDLQTELRRSFDALFGEGAGSVVLHGARPMGVDWSGIGFGEIVSKNARSPLDLAGAALSVGLSAPYNAYQRYSSGQGELAAARELLPNAAKHMLDALYPELSLTSISGKSKMLSEQQLSDADRVKMGLGFQPEIKAEKGQQTQERIRLVEHYKAGISKAENRIANLLARGDREGADTAIQDATSIIQNGVQAGAFSINEGREFQRSLRQKIIQRMHPEIPPRVQQRIEAAQRLQ